MTPFQSFRLWIRRAPAGERAIAALASSLVLVVLAWLGVPSVSQTDVVSSGFAEAGGAPGTVAQPGAANDSTAGPPAPGSSDSAGQSAAMASAGTTAPAGVAAGSSAPGGSSGGRSSRAAGGKGASASCPEGSARGATAERLDVAIVLVQIVGPGANTVFGVARVEDQRRYWDAVVADINAGGGAGCRKLVPTYYEGNPADRNSLQALCLEITDSDAFAVIDNGAYVNYPVVECYPRNKMPYFGGYLISQTVAERNYPYLFELNLGDRLHRDTVYALKERGFYSSANGFKKLAFPYRTCDPVLVKKMRGWLADAGVSAAQIVEYDFGCPSALASPSDVQQAVLTFQRAGATHLTYAGFVGDFANFTKVAEQQGYRPKYGLPNDSLISVSSGSGGPDPDNLANAITIAASRDGEETTPGSTPSPGTARCNRLLKANVYELANVGGNTCALAWMFDAAVDNAPAMAREALVAGLQRARTVEMPFPQGPNDFSKPRTVTGGQFWRPVQFKPACDCWQLLDRTFRPTFP